MTQIPGEKNVYCCTIEGQRCLFADEVVKKHLLDCVGELQRKNGWNLYAFCVMDNAAYFVIGAKQSARVVRELLNAVQKQLCLSVHGQSRRRGVVELSGHTKKLSTLVQIADCCREIHRIPLQQGYVNRLEDYWWSSYPAYAGVRGGESLVKF